MEINFIELWDNMPLLVKAVVVVLTLQALASLYVLVDRTILLVSSSRRSRAFARAASEPLVEKRFHEAVEVARAHQKSHLASFIHAGIETFLARVDEGHSREKAAEFAKRTLERDGENLSEMLNRGLNILASTGSTAPFIGLLGTVLGILNAFRLIGEEASGGMATIGPAISEALVVTGYGLLVAIPAVLLFNALSARIAKYEAGLANAGSELIDALEATREVSSVQPVSESGLSASRSAVA